MRAGRIYNYGRLRLKAFLGRDRTYCGFCNHKTESRHYQHMSSANWPSTLPMDPYLQPHMPCKNASSKLTHWYVSYMFLITPTSSRHEFPLTRPFFWHSLLCLQFVGSTADRDFATVYHPPPPGLRSHVLENGYCLEGWIQFTMSMPCHFCW